MSKNSMPWFALSRNWSTSYRNKSSSCIVITMLSSFYGPKRPSTGCTLDGSCSLRSLPLSSSIRPEFTIKMLMLSVAVVVFSTLSKLPSLVFIACGTNMKVMKTLIQFGRLALTDLVFVNFSFKMAFFFGPINYASPRLLCGNFLFGSSMPVV